jgi:hypothetical protein
MKIKYNQIILGIILILIGLKVIPTFLTCKYKVEICVIPIRGGNFMEVEKFIGSIVSYNVNPSDEKKKILDSLSKFFEFGNSIQLININEKWGKTSHQFSDTSFNVNYQENYLSYKFEKIQTKNDLPVVCIKSIIPVKPFNYIKIVKDIDYAFLTNETEFWPVNNPKIMEIKEKIIIKNMSEKEKILAIMDWIGKNIIRGKEEGTRYGPIKVIEQGYGRCWDFSDVFITLCRASGIPARQVFGILYKKGGHAWNQVFIKDKGWISIDAPIRKFGVGSNYIPLSISEYGNMTFLYYSLPKVERI